MSQYFKATIDENSTRAQAWLEVFGTREIPLRSPLPEWALARGVEESLFYQLDLAEITQEQREKLIKHLSAEFEVDEREVAATLDEVGCSILAEDITITAFNPQKWI